MSKTSVDGSGILKWYDHVTGIFNEIFYNCLNVIP